MSHYAILKYAAFAAAVGVCVTISSRGGYMRHLFFVWLLSAVVSCPAVYAEDLTLLIFGAEWCGACKKLEAVIAQEPAIVLGFSVAEFDIDAEPDLAKNYGIRTVPTLIVLEPDGTMRRKVGFTGKADLAQWLRQKN